MANAGTETAVKKQSEREQTRRDRELLDIRAVMKTQEGRRVINRILAESNVMGEIFSPNGSVTNLNLGMRKVGLFVYQELELACPDLSLLMRQEYVKENSNA